MYLSTNLEDQDVRIFLTKHFKEATIHSIDIEPDPAATINNCFPNVRSKIQREGGEMVVGWSILKGEIMVEAEFHAVWRSPSGTLVDITPTTIETTRTLFAEVNGLTYEGIQKDNIRESITLNPLIGDFFTLCEALFRLRNFGNRKYQQGFLTLSGPDATNYESLSAAQQLLLGMIKKNQGKNSPCFCGGGNKYKHCCGKTISKADVLYRNDFHVPSRSTAT